jgi:hypothetical protein
VGKMLVKDSRNFHGWGYRRKVVSELESPRLGGRSMVESEFEYTTKMIHGDKGLSNFSAWHRRSKLIPRLLDERNASDEARRQFLDDGSLSLPPSRAVLTSHQNLTSLFPPCTRILIPTNSLHGSITNSS